MKKIAITFAAATVVILLLFTGCDKYHRDRYIGNWDFVTEKSQLQYDSNELIKSDTIYYSGKIYSGNDDNTLIIQCTKNDRVPAYIDNKGILWISFPTFYGTCHKCPLGKFEKKDKITLDFYRFWEEDIKSHYQITGRRSK